MSGSELLNRPPANSLDAEVLTGVQLSGQPLLAVPHRDTLEVSAQFLIHNKLVLFCIHHLHPAHDLLELVLKDVGKQHNQPYDEQGESLVTARPHRVLCIQGNRLVNERFKLVIEDLHVAHRPIPKKQHEDWCDAHKFQGSLINLVIVDGWSLIPIGY